METKRGAWSSRRVYRSRQERMLCGVAGGLGTHFGVDPTLIRLLFVLAGLTTGGTVLLLYVLMCIVVPLEPLPYEREADTLPRGNAWGE